MCLCIYMCMPASQRHTRHHRSSRVLIVTRVLARVWTRVLARKISTFTQAQYLSTQPRETRTLTQAMKARQKRRMAGPTTGCSPIEVSCIEEKQRVRRPAVKNSGKKRKKKNKYVQTPTHKYACWYVLLSEQRERIRVRQPAVRYNHKSKQTNMHTCVSVYVYVHEERERISITLVTTAAQGCPSDLCMCVRACMCWYYFTNLSTVSVCLPEHIVVTQTRTHTHKQH
jgi:hypothetical protein